MLADATFGALRPAALSAAGILEPGVEGRINANLLAEPQYLMFLENGVADGVSVSPQQVVAGLTCLPGIQFLEILEREKNRAAALDSIVLVACSMEDLAVLRSQGLPVVPAIGFDTLGGESLRALCAALKIRSWFSLDSLAAGAELPSSADDPHGEATHPQDQIGAPSTVDLVLVGFSLAALNETVADEAATNGTHRFESVESHLTKINQHLGLEVCTGVWRPDPEERQRL